MQFIVDLHIHSHFSRATSKQMNTEDLYYWGKIKGINIIGTGDFTHPQYFKELEEKLEPAEEGLYKLKDKYAKVKDKMLPASVRDRLIRFIPTVEISNIYSKAGKVRKLHNLIVTPDLKSAKKLNIELDKIGNIKADGRPILGMDSKDLLELTIKINKDNLFIPAHIWTPWFSMFGSKSGFDTIEESFGNLAGEIKAVETGLSSDPWMNWRINELQNVTLVSNSDAHSPQKLGREANIVDAGLNYEDIIGAIRTNDKRFVGTIEFYPEEGKYHYDGHRACGRSFMPSETKKLKGICPKCKKPLTVGVQNRVDELADNPESFKYKTNKSVEYIIPLTEMIAEIKEVKNTSSKKVVMEYEKLIAEFGDEFSILRNIDVSKMRDGGFVEIAHSIDKMRKGEVFIEPGYDGVFGVINVYGNKKQRAKLSGQQSLL